MEVINLNVEAREGRGKGPTRRLRATGRVPAIVYRGGQEPTAISIDPSELELTLRRTGNRNTLFTLPAGGRDRLCLIKEVQHHPISRKILHVDFYEVASDEAVVVDVRVEASGKCIGVKKGGLLRSLVRTLKVRCLPGVIPTVIEVDVTDVDLGKSVRVAEVKAPDGVQLLFDVNFNVFMVSGREEEEGEAPVAAAAPVAGAPVAAPVTGKPVASASGKPERGAGKPTGGAGGRGGGRR
jgi:large subunit ribosomal protein L25